MADLAQTILYKTMFLYQTVQASLDHSKTGPFKNRTCPVLGSPLYLVVCIIKVMMKNNSYFSRIITHFRSQGAPTLKIGVQLYNFKKYYYFYLKMFILLLSTLSWILGLNNNTLFFLFQVRIGNTFTKLFSVSTLCVRRYLIFCLKYLRLLVKVRWV